MYGLIFENFSGYIKVGGEELIYIKDCQVKYGEEAWENVRKMANIDTPTFSIHQVDCFDEHLLLKYTPRYKIYKMSPYTQVYPEQLLGKIAKKAFATLGCSADEFFEVSTG